MPPSTNTVAPAGNGVQRGSVREVLHLAYPVVLTQLSTAAMNLVDSAMVGRLGATELGAVGFSQVWLWTLFSLATGTATGAQTFISQADGAGAQHRCGAWIWQGVYAALPVAIVLTLILYPLAGPCTRWLGPSPELETAAVAYARARLPGEAAFTLLMVFTAFFRGIGDTRTPLYAMLVANAVNAVLDYALIFAEFGAPAWGVVGAGVATATSHWLGALLLFVLLRRGRVADRYRTRLAPPDPLAIRRFLRTGAPIGGQWFIGMTAFAVFTTLVARMGDESMAASQAFVMLVDVSFLGALGISIGASTLVGRYVGARDEEAAVRSFRSALKLCLGMALGFALLFVTVPKLLLRIFTDDPAVLELGGPLLLIGALFQICDAATVVTQGALRGAGDTRWPFVVEMVLAWTFFVPLAYLLGVVMDRGLLGAWAGGLVYFALLSLLMLHRFRSGAWRRIQI